MAYTIGYVVLGLSFVHSPYDGTPDLWKAFRDELSEHLNNRTIPGFESRYSGGDSAPEYFGIDLGQFDECSNITGKEMIDLCTASQEQMIAYMDLVDQLKSNEDVSEELRAAIAMAKAEVIILWGTS